MKKIITYFFAVSLLFFTYSCSSSETDSTDSDAKDSLTVVEKLDVESYYLGLYDGKDVLESDNNIFHRGDKIYFSLENVTGLQKGADDLYYIDLSLEVKNELGELVASHSDVYGDKGHRDFKQGVVKQPFVFFATDAEMPIGSYIFTLIIHDKVVKDSIVLNKEFILE